MTRWGRIGADHMPTMTPRDNPQKTTGGSLRPRSAPSRPGRCAPCCTGRRNIGGAMAAIVVAQHAKCSVSAAFAGPTCRASIERVGSIRTGLLARHRNGGMHCGLRRSSASSAFAISPLKCSRFSVPAPSFSCRPGQSDSFAASIHAKPLSAMEKAAPSIPGPSTFMVQLRPRSVPPVSISPQLGLEKLAAGSDCRDRQTDYNTTKHSGLHQRGRGSE